MTNSVIIAGLLQQSDSEPPLIVVAAVHGDFLACLSGPGYWMLYVSQLLNHQVCSDERTDVIATMNCLCCLAGFVVEPLFNAFATAAFFEFVNFAIFEMQYLLSIWRARRGPALDTWQTQRELAILYIRFYGALLGSIFVTYQSQR